MAQKLLGKLFADKRGPLPPKYEPKLHIRINNDRTRRIYEFSVPLPLEGYSSNSWEECILKMHEVFEKAELLKARPQPAEKKDGDEKTRETQESAAGQTTEDCD